MKHTTFLATAALLPALVAFAPKADSLKFAPAEGSSVTKAFHTNSDFSLDDMTVLINGEPNPMMPEISMQMVISQNVSVTDTYDKLAGGKPAKLTRKFDSASMEMEMNMEVDMMGETQNENGNGSGTSKLDGTTVVFTWDEESGEYKASYPEGEEGDADLLTNLAENMDLRGLLPASGELSEGDSYEIDLKALIDVFAPGGDLKLDVEMEGAEAGMGPDPAMMADFRRIFEEMVEGEASGKFVGTRDIDGTKVGVVELTFKINASRDMSEFVSELMGEQMPEGMDMSVNRLDVEFQYEGGGELHWDLAAGRAHGLALKGEANIAMDMEMSMDMGGQAMTISMEMAMSGSMENGMSVE
ncbi:MAG: hypothetical protein R3F49_14555 [Planctomycetota bacterium]